MLRGEEWQSCAVPLMWVEFTADIIQHHVREVTSGTRFSVTLFTPSHLERLSPEDWMNLESFGFPVKMYAEMDSKPPSNLKLEASSVAGGTEVEQLVEPPLATDMLTMASGPSLVSVHRVEKQPRAHEDPIHQLTGKVPQPCEEGLASEHLALAACALLTREFNVAMGLPKRELPRCIDKERGATHGRMLREEVNEVEEAVSGGILPEVLAESIDVLYLAFNLLQECGLEQAIEPAFLEQVLIIMDGSRL